MRSIALFASRVVLRTICNGVRLYLISLLVTSGEQKSRLSLAPFVYRGSRVRNNRPQLENTWESGGHQGTHEEP